MVRSRLTPEAWSLGEVPDFALGSAYDDGVITLTLQGDLRREHSQLFDGVLCLAVSCLPGRLVIDAWALDQVDPALVEALVRVCKSPGGHLVPIVVRGAGSALHAELTARDLDGLTLDRDEDAADERDRRSRGRHGGRQCGR